MKKTPEKVAKAKELYQSGMSQREVGEEIGVCKQTISNWISDEVDIREFGSW